MKTILALGADIKNRVCLLKEGRYFFGTDIGNLEDAENFDMFHREVRDLCHKHEAVPDIVVSDMHPGYFSTRFARQNFKNVRFIQHHHAHIASVVAEHNIKEPVIGVAFDGTGFGTDGTVWGGEFLLVDSGGFKRAGSMKPVPMPGGETATREPWRMALSYLCDALGDKIWDYGPGFLKDIPKEKLKVAENMILKRFNSPLTSSAGRLFDAVSALLGLGNTASYEAEAAIKLQRSAESADRSEEAYGFEVKENGIYSVDVKNMFLEILEDIKKTKEKSHIAFKFHNTMADIIHRLCAILREETGLNTAALSGGVFQNTLLEGLSLEKLQKDDFEVFINRKIPVNDLGISLGQAKECTWR